MLPDALTQAIHDNLGLCRLEGTTSRSRGVGGVSRVPACRPASTTSRASACPPASSRRTTGSCLSAPETTSAAAAADPTRARLQRGSMRSLEFPFIQRDTLRVDGPAVAAP
jgi:hypothetical protein